MPQLIVTPHALYKWFRAMTVGYDSAGTEGVGFYIEKTLEYSTVAGMQLKYFEVGYDSSLDVTDPELTRQYFDAEIKDGNSGKGRVKNPVNIFAGLAGYDATNTKKELLAANFYNYGNSNASKVTGQLAIVADTDGYWYQLPGVVFQVGCHLTQAEANGSNINQIGIYDDDDTLMWFGVMSKQEKTAASSLKINCVGMMKTLDYQLVL